MRKLIKAPKPRVLEAQETALTEEFRVNPRATPWKHAEIIRVLEQETRSKCAYCESKVAAVAWNHVEHILPKSKYPELVVAWNNLTIACPRCNVYKSDYADDDAPLLNPFVDEPSVRLVFAFGLVRPIPGDASSEATVTLLRLHRIELSEQRHAAVAQLELLLTNWYRAAEPLKEPIMEIIREYISDDAEFVGSLRAYLRHVGFSTTMEAVEPDPS